MGDIERFPKATFWTYKVFETEPLPGNPALLEVAVFPQPEIITPGTNSSRK
jgi:hypothetical protein